MISDFVAGIFANIPTTPPPNKGMIQMKPTLYQLAQINNYLSDINANGLSEYHHSELFPFKLSAYGLAKSMGRKLAETQKPFDPTKIFGWCN